MVLIFGKNTYFFVLFFVLFSLISCGQIKSSEKIITGAESSESYIHLLKNKRVGIVANQTSVISKINSTKEYELYYNTNSISDTIISKNKIFVHIVDSLLSLRVDVKKVFAPEHGFRGQADAGEMVKDGIDTKTGLPIVSLYGKNKKPTKNQLDNLDVIIFDIQDVGVRFYTYISTLHYVMEACAEIGIPIIVLDRPNPNGYYIDGPILEQKHKSFVGMHTVPVVYGMTIGEYAQMINGEKWLNNGIKAKLTVIPLKNYNHNSNYSLPIKPSPNLPNDKSINLYPSLCFFEGTNVSAGRGTDMQFQIYGSPYLKKTDFTFVPQSNEGAKNPKHRRKVCYGEDLRNFQKLSELNLSWLLKAYQQNNTAGSFFNSYFTTLSGTEKLQSQIQLGLNEKEIKKSWKNGLEKFKKTRKKYLLYN